MNKSTGTYAAAGENAKPKGSSSKSKLARALASALMMVSEALRMLSPVGAMADEKSQSSEYQADVAASTHGGAVSLTQIT